MKKLAYLECPTGIAGDMCLGALVHAGVPLEYLVEQLGRLGISREYHLWSELVLRNGQQATKVHVDLVAAEAIATDSEHQAEPTTFAPFHSATEKLPTTTHNHAGHAHPHAELGQPTHPDHHPNHDSVHGRHLPEIEQLIVAAQLPSRAEAWSLAVFRRLAEAEGAVHGIAPEQVHFHEVGATDAIVDIVGTCLGLDWLEIDQLYCSAFPTGGGTIRAAHGLLPVPTPAVMKLWETRQVPIYHNGVNRELVTPTGAAIAVTLATRFGPTPPMTLQKVGLGAGSRNLQIPNILRLWLGEGEGETETQQLFSLASKPAVQPHASHNHNHTHHNHSHATPAPIASPMVETVTVLETQIDDLNPQAIAYVLNALLAAGALDVFTQAVGMKKSRLGTLITVICHPEQAATCEAILFRETTTLGIRRSTQQRTILERAIVPVETDYGAVRVKVAWAGPQPMQAITNVQPEYEDCAQIAQQHDLPWREVHRLALQSWYQHHKKSAQTASVTVG